MIINKEKNQRIEIDKKPPELVRTKKKNRFVGGAGYCIFIFFFFFNTFYLTSVCNFLVMTDPPYF